MPVEVVTKKACELFSSLDVGTGVHHVAARQGFVKGGIITTIQFIHHHFPHGMASTWTVVSVTITLVRHTEIQSVWPDGYTAKRCCDGCIIDEKLISHHFELLIATHSQVWRSHADDRAVSDVGKALDDEPGSCHLGQPVVVGAASPVVGFILVRQREHSNFMSAPVQVLYCRVVRVLVRHEKCASNLTSIWILSQSIEDFLI